MRRRAIHPEPVENAHPAERHMRAKLWCHVPGPAGRRRRQHAARRLGAGVQQLRASGLVHETNSCRQTRTRSCCKDPTPQPPQQTVDCYLLPPIT